MILVWPGTYHENVYVENKNITIGSLCLTTGDISYRNSTIINGDSTRSCFIVKDCEIGITINGFTCEDGYGLLTIRTCGGGIYMEDSKGEIINCLIQNNFARSYGGGVFFEDCIAKLSNNIIRYNHAFWHAGGVMSLKSVVEFDSVNRNSIYCNYSPVGTDFVKMSYDTLPFTLHLDTFTIINPNQYYACHIDGDYFTSRYITFDINSGKISQVYGDLYVSIDGDNSNSGLSADESLRDIAYALLKIGKDSINYNTIHIAAGEYSYNTGEKFPFGLKQNLSLVGENKNTTLLNGNDVIFHVYNPLGPENITVSNLTFLNGNGDKNSSLGYGSVNFELNDNLRLESLNFKNNYATYSCGISIGNISGVRINNVDVFENEGAKSTTIAQTNLDLTEYDTVYITNSKFYGNYPDFSIPDHAGGGAIVVMGKYNALNNSFCAIVNCLIENNEIQYIYNTVGTSGVLAYNFANVYLVNNTIVNNISGNPKSVALGVTYGSTMNLYNTIVYNNEYYPAYMYTDIWGDCHLNVYNSLFEGGREAIQLHSAYNYINYDNTNIDTDPLFYGGSEFPFNLSENSPCIDAGTLDIPSWIQMPDTDLAVNPRIYGDGIDIGAYEWNPTVGKSEVSSINDKIQLTASPNPFSKKTVINLSVTEPATLNLEVYNCYGQRVKTLLQKQKVTGTATIPWDGCNNNGNNLKTGNYLLVLEEEGKEVRVVKLILMK